MPRSSFPAFLLSCFTALLATALALFVLLEVNYAQLSPLSQLALFAMAGMVLAFVLFPSRWRWLDYGLAVASAGCCLYLVAQGQALGQRMGELRPMDIAVGIAGVALVLEATRRSIGWALPILALIFVAYAYFGNRAPQWLFPHRGYDLDRIVSQTFLRTEGVFGTALQVMFTYVYLFVLFGAFLSASGATQFIIDLAQRLFGHRPGGAAKVSVLASGLMGSLSGSAVANAATTGTFTIPMMRSIGFRPHIAAGIEAATSSGGALVPPVMGAGAYMMLDIIGAEVTYLQIIRAALIPAILYYLSIFLLVHFYAHRIGGQEAEDRGQVSKQIAAKPSAWPAGVTFFAALGSLMGFLLAEFSVFRAVTYALAVVIVLQIINPQKSLTMLHRAVALMLCIALPVAAKWMMPISWPDAVVFAVAGVLLAGLTHAAWRPTLVAAFVQSAKSGNPLIVAAACVGIIIGIVTLTGVGTAFPNAIMPLAQHNLFLALVAIMGCSIVLGMGLPSAVSYLLLAILIGPTLGTLGVPILAAHFFIFYFGLMAMVTPPVALAAYATASIASADITRSSLAAFRFSLVGFTLPFMFVYRPQLLLLDVEGDGLPLMEVAAAVTAAGVGVTALAAAMAGYLFTPLPRVWRIVLFVAAACALFPEQHWELASGLSIPMFDLLGAALLATAATVNWRSRRRGPALVS